ncbi:L-type lectin-domain containing receptor kinase VII.1 [Camellia lanceoleosa]|uniref:L-type lectin-domain containing receptor kinase VII.1 n=1 Tax=Camellia lanceoleosa TaxID=1840588 RepID=A0ACC0GLE0_9ERIC|nr:L-type lectin-domain containing receptor kinase VII.1 [Camellia lanceoleosa]
MENGSLDKRVFECDDETKISELGRENQNFERRGFRGVIHACMRGGRPGNVLLDKEMNERLGDFELARRLGHRQAANTTQAVGTVGYLAPEVIRSGLASTQTEVFGFGVLILEVMCGRRPIEEGKPHLVDWVWELRARGELVLALDERLKNKGYNEEEVERVVHLWLLCAYQDS